MVLENYFPPDTRVEKETRALLNAGHKIVLLSLGKKGTPLVENINGIKVVRVLPPENLRFWRNVWFSVFFYRFFWKNALENIVEQYGIDAIHVHDLPLVKTALFVAKKFNVPIIADLHENFPEGIRVWRKIEMTVGTNVFNLISPVWRWKRLEKSLLKKVDKLITVVDEAKYHYVDECGISAEDITVVINTADLELFDNIEIDKSLVSKYKNDFVISYIGSFFAHHRGLDTVIKAMLKISEKIPNAKLLLVGQGQIEESLKKLCSDLKVRNNVVFTGWVDFNFVPTYIAISDVCLVPHYSSGHTNTTIPHKLFHYMAMKKPVIVTDCKPLKRIVEECDCGIVVPSGNYDKMAEAIVRLSEDKEFARELGRNGRSMVEERYNWNNEGTKLVEVYNNLKLPRKG